MTTFKKLKRELKKKHPKAWARAEKLWDFKMHDDVLDFTFNIVDMINWKTETYDGSGIEEMVWELLRKVRRITIKELKNERNSK